MSKRSRAEADGDAVASIKRVKKHKQKSADETVAASESVEQQQPPSAAPEQEDGDDDKAAHKAEKAARKAAKAEKKAAKAAKAERKAQKEAGRAAATDDQSPSADAALPTKASQGAYSQAAALTALPQADIDAFLTKSQITIIDETSRSTPLRPITSFEHLPLSSEKLRKVFSAFKEPSPIQAAAWPYLLAGRDAIGVAETGSGKTMAFGLPCVQHVHGLTKAKSSQVVVRACIVSPTRELALQIHEQMTKLATPLHLKVACVYGGVNKDEQRTTLSGASIIVATPGRLNDFIQEQSLSLSSTSFLVLDEADRMLDKGFEPEVRKIVAACLPKSQRQTLMFTATWPPIVRELAATFMRDPVRVMIGDNATGELRANVRITQSVEVMEPHEKNGRLLEVLRQHNGASAGADRMLIFCLYKKEAVRVEDFVRSRGFKVAGIHGDLSQQKRTESLDAFKTGKVRLLIATDVAARGLDIPAVKLVVNYTFPLTADDYVHRIGRTGRAGQTGESITFFTEHDKPLAGALMNVLRAAGQTVPEALLKFGTTVKRKGHEAYGAFYREPSEMKKATKITFD